MRKRDPPPLVPDDDIVSPMPNGSCEVNGEGQEKGEKKIVNGTKEDTRKAKVGNREDKEEKGESGEKEALNGGSSSKVSEKGGLRKLILYLRDVDKDMTDSWNVVFHDSRLANLAEACGYELEVDIQQDDILKVRADVLVSPANGTGDMHGGIDGVYLRKFGARLETDVIEQIKKRNGGLLPVGKSVIVSMRRYTDQFRFLISSPTMLLPGKPSEPLSSMLAFKTTLETIKAYNDKTKNHPITSLACPGLGTGVGGVPPFRCALQMRAALDSFFGCGFANRDLKRQREHYILLATIKKPFSITQLYEP